uniref:Uncharacterized protein n=1 Tax=mine drainage metagenome TaxID=410659 RepID=E6QQF9_9ZZZZ
MPHHQFQSSPTPEGGRYTLIVKRKSSLRRFQSSMVSILAHPGGWALLSSPQQMMQNLLFQSSPTPEGGRYLGDGMINAPSDEVSILAHPGGWALPFVDM